MNSILLELKDIAMSYGQTSILKGLSLQVKEGEVFGLLGPSGCGKTTLLRVIAGLERANQGQVKLKEQWVDGEHFVSVTDRSVGLVYQDPLLFPHLSNWENVMIATSHLKSESNKSEDWAHELFHLLRVAEHKNKFPDQISGGQQQRVALARALVSKPDLLLLDEPFANLDIVLKEDLIVELRELFQALKMTVVFVSHDRDEMFHLCDRLAVFESGVLKQVGSPKELYQNPNSRFVAEFLGKANFISKPKNQNTYTMVRPEEITLVGHSSGEYRVRAVVFQGFYQSVHLDSVKEGEVLEVKVIGTCDFKVGDLVNVEISS